MLSTCTDAVSGCNALVDVDPWVAYPDEYAGVPHLCREHIKPHVDTIRQRFAERRAKSKNEG